MTVTTRDGKISEELTDAMAVMHTGVNLDQATITAGPFSFEIFHLSCSARSW